MLEADLRNRTTRGKLTEIAFNCFSRLNYTEEDTGIKRHLLILHVLIQCTSIDWRGTAEIQKGKASWNRHTINGV